MLTEVRVEVHADPDYDSDDEEDLAHLCRPHSQAEVVRRLPSRRRHDSSLERDGSTRLQRRASTFRCRQRRNTLHPPPSRQPSSRSSMGRPYRDYVDQQPGGEMELEGEEETWRRLQQVKSMMSSLDHKRRARSQLLSTPTQKSRGFKKWNYKRSKAWQTSRKHLVEFGAYFSIFHGSFKTIEGYFGSSVLAYFQFLKWLLMLNVFTTLVILAVIVFPQGFMAPNTFNETMLSGNESTASLSRYQAEAVACSSNYTMYLDDLTSKHQDRVGELVIDFFQGTGFMESTYLFVGYYFNKTYFFEQNEQHYMYNMPLAYLLATAGYYTVTLFLMVRYTARGVRQNLATQGEKYHQAFNKVFSAWDYSLTDDKSSKLEHKNIHMAFTNYLGEWNRKKRQAEMGTRDKCKVYLVRMLVNLLVLVCLTGAGALIYYVTVQWVPELKTRSSVQSTGFLSLIVEFLPSFTITALNAIIPLLFEKLALLEDYTPSGEIKITIIRTVLLRIASLFVLAVSLANQIQDCSSEERHCGNCGDTIKCWESYVGQQIYKLVILDFIVVIIITFCLEFPRRAVVRKFSRFKIVEFVGPQEFDIPKCVLDIVYSQTLCWWGAFYSPLIPAITAVKFFIFFYCKKVSLLYNCDPSSRSYQASRSNYFFMIILMVSFMLCTAAVAYTVGRIHPSQTCSPFRVYSNPEFYMFNSVTDAVETLPSVIRDIFRFIGNWIFYASLLVIMILLIYYYTAVSSGNKKMVALLKEQLAREGKDKQFLLAKVSEALMHGDFYK